MNKVIFLDIDGCICIYDPASLSPSKMEYNYDNCKRVQKLARAWGAKIVISSDRRLFGEDILSSEPLLMYFDREDFHPDIETPAFGPRHEEVSRWLDSHPEVDDYICIDDIDIHYVKASEEMLQNLYLCDASKGFDNLQYEKAKWTKIIKDISQQGNLS